MAQLKIGYHKNTIMSLYKLRKDKIVNVFNRIRMARLVFL